MGLFQRSSWQRCSTPLTGLLNSIGQRNSKAKIADRKMSIPARSVSSSNGFLNSAKSLMMVAILSLTFFSACDAKFESANTEPFQDVIFSSKESKAFVIATGRKGVYVLAGKYKYVGAPAYPGTLCGFDRRHYFLISDLLQTYPSLASERVKQEAERQQRWIEKVRDGKHRL